MGRLSDLAIESHVDIQDSLSAMLDRAGFPVVDNPARDEAIEKYWRLVNRAKGVSTDCIVSGDDVTVKWRDGSTTYKNILSGR